MLGSYSQVNAEVTVFLCPSNQSYASEHEFTCFGKQGQHIQMCLLCWYINIANLLILKKPMRARTESTRWEKERESGHRVGKVGQLSSNETNGTENVSPTWTRLLRLAPNFCKVAFQPPAMEATASRKNLSGCCELGTFISLRCPRT